MGQRFYWGFIILSLALLTGCMQRSTARYERYLEEMGDSTSGIDFITPAKDSVMAAEEMDMDDIFNDDDDLIGIPEIPQERDVDMGANNYELEKIMMGKE